MVVTDVVHLGCGGVGLQLLDRLAAGDHAADGGVL